MQFALVHPPMRVWLQNQESGSSNRIDHKDGIRWRPGNK